MAHFQSPENYRLHLHPSLCRYVNRLRYLNHQEIEMRNTDCKLSFKGFKDELMLPYVQIHLKPRVFISMIFFCNFFTLNLGSDSYIDRRWSS